MGFSLDDARLFSDVVEHGGFTAASEATGIAKSTLSKRVAMLEQQLGARLLHRNSRRLSLSEAGEAFLGPVRAMLVEAEAASATIEGRLAEPRGAVRITASAVTTRYYLAPLMPALAERYPRIVPVLHATDRMVDIVQESFDIAVRDHFAPLPASDLVQQPIGSEPDWLVASPGYVRRHGEPDAPAALATCDGVLGGPVGRPGGWRLRPVVSDANSEAPTLITPRIRFVADDPDSLVGMVLAGVGIAALPRCICQPHLRIGGLVRLLPQWIAGQTQTTVLMPHRRGRLPAVRAVVEVLMQALSERFRQ